jgi:hypothetical protein
MPWPAPAQSMIDAQPGCELLQVPLPVTKSEVVSILDAISTAFS